VLEEEQIVGILWEVGSHARCIVFPFRSVSLLRNKAEVIGSDRIGSDRKRQRAVKVPCTGYL